MLIQQPPRRAYSFDNDLWSPEIVEAIGERTAQQTIPRERAAGLVIGSGGLPYILACIGVASLVVADLHQRVIDTTLWRVDKIRNHTDWSEYNNAVRAELNGYDAAYFDREVEQAERSGLAADFATTQAAATTTRLSGARGDIRRTARDLGGQMRRSDYHVTFVNVTNAASYVGGRKLTNQERMESIGKAISKLPLADDAIVIDSSPTLTPKLYAVSEYPGLVTD